MVPALELMDSVDELRRALDDPAGFLKNLERSVGPEAKRFMIAKLRPKLAEKLQNHGLRWEEAWLLGSNFRH